MCKRSVSTYIKARGLEAILSETDYNLRRFKNHIRTVCNLKMDKNISYIIKQAKDVLEQRSSYCDIDIEILKRTLKEAFKINK